MNQENMIRNILTMTEFNLMTYFMILLGYLTSKSERIQDSQCIGAVDMYI